MGANSICQWKWPKRSEWMKGKVVGCGSFGTVHLAINKSTGGLFVVKSPHSGAGREALAKEVKILETLNSSPYIVKCLGTEEDQGKINIFMEYMAGGNLSDVAHEFGGSLEEEVVRVYTREILLGLKHLHQNGVVHCDLKCKNVLLGSSGNIKLADFGCATRVKDLADCWHSIGGTPLWMAPEVLRNESVDFAADIWSLGCTIIEMATGTPPWAHQISNPFTAVISIAHGHEIPQFPPHFSEEGLDFLSKCLEREPSKRCTAEELLVHPFVSTRLSHQKCVSSPASVLDVQNFNDTYYDLDGLESSEGNDFSTTKSFACHDDGPKGITMCKQEDSALRSSGNWITVRSG
ncbi:mitogen-activated protein kinase kinase kinase NPK1 [Cajanus cajan]|uniref:Mitogen-activated protein kinase kinase kinase 3 n=1 Tax=Cajanus cajan TaxID=3821 RepID=A0A151T891_CAJCA|nr:mitogen-activated protein kinase kinase kinase NPK1 [Cajanus cajan]XP_020221844.1 mitogen-activated protein kinase kinase kinase NPK1 [Cajanus cajan]KYP63161.1 Mitogen-activated protein kinase kinase kinase 3 [Cajanus cajan]KYP63231.1 Mitogen-activated protein kinase kinase kinase 3 [Cajanus cajan]